MAKKSSAQIWLEYIPVRLIMGFLGFLPLKWAIFFGVSAGSVAYRLFGRLRRVGMRNLEIAFPEKPIEERREILKNAFRNLGRVLAFFSHSGDVTLENATDYIEYNPDPEFARKLEEATAAGRGKIMLTGHQGNWELHALTFPRFMGPLSFLARKMDNPKIEEYVFNIRTRLGNQQIDKTNSAATMLRMLRKGGSIGVLADVNSHPKEGVFVPFFGIPACTSTGIAMLAGRANAVIVPVLGIWDPEKNKYFVAYDDIIEPVDTGDRKTDIEQTTALCAAATERMIRRYPDQWVWIHRRWKSRPPGEEDLYKGI